MGSDAYAETITLIERLAAKGQLGENIRLDRAAFILSTRPTIVSMKGVLAYACCQLIVRSSELGAVKASRLLWYWLSSMFR